MCRYVKAQLVEGIKKCDDAAAKDVDMSLVIDGMGLSLAHNRPLLSVISAKKLISAVLISLLPVEVTTLIAAIMHQSQAK